MNRTTQRAGRDQLRAGLTTAWVLLTSVLAVASGMLCAPTAGATGLLPSAAPIQTSLPAVTLRLSTTAAGATDVTDLIEFKMPSAAPHGVWVKIATGGTQVLPTCGHITDMLTGVEDDACAAGAATPSNQMTVSASALTISRGDAVAVEFEGVANGQLKKGVRGAPATLIRPPSGVTFGLRVWASNTEAGLPGHPVGTASYRFSPMSTLLAASVSLSSHAMGATEVTYGVTFQTSPTGGLTPDGTITVKAAPNVVLPTCGHVTDLSTGYNSDACAGGATKPSNEMTISMQGTDGIAAGDTVWVEFNGVSDKAVPILPRGPDKSVTQSLQIWTSSDGRDITRYTLFATKSIANVYAQLSKSVAGARNVTYAVIFQTSTIGGLAPDGTITVAVAGIRFPTCGQVTDLATGASSDACSSNQTLRLPQSPISTGAFAIGAGDDVEVVFTGVTNPAAPGNHQLTVSTSSDGPHSTTFSLSPE